MKTDIAEADEALQAWILGQHERLSSRPCGRVAFCALATGKGRDHDFQYRARGSDGGVVLLHDMVHVIKGELNLPTRLRGVMVAVPG